MTESLEQWQKRVSEYLEPDDLDDWTNAIIFLLVAPQPLETLQAKHKLVLLVAAYKRLPASKREKLGKEQFQISRKLESGSFGIDIKDALQLNDGWSLLVEADGGSGSLEPWGDELDDHPITFNLARLAEYAEEKFFHLTNFSWHELSSDASLDDGSVSVAPGEGMDSYGTPTFELLSPDGTVIQIPEGQISLEPSGEASAGKLFINLDYRGQTFSFEKQFNLDECESSCLGYNLSWTADEPKESVEFEQRISELLTLALSKLKESLLTSKTE
jgi:hypothetical protein